MYNWLTIEGRLTSDPVMRSTHNNKSVANFSLACNNKAGNREEVLFQDCVAWEKYAEIISKYTKRGDKLLVGGRLSTNKYTNKDGQQISKNVLTVSALSLQDNRSNSDRVGEYDNGGSVFTTNEFAELGDIEDEDDLPF